MKRNISDMPVQCKYDYFLYGTAIEKQIYDDKFNGVWITERVDTLTFNPADRLPTSSK